MLDILSKINFLSFICGLMIYRVLLVKQCFMHAAFPSHAFHQLKSLPLQAEFPFAASLRHRASASGFLCVKDQGQEAGVRCG